MQPISSDPGDGPAGFARWRVAAFALVVACGALGLFAQRRTTQPRAPEGASAALAEQLRAARTAHAKAAEVLEQAQARSAAAQVRLQGFLTGHFDQFSEAAPAAKSPAIAPKPQVAPNPVWQELTRKIEQMQSARSAMLTRLTEAHPDVQSIEVQIVEVERARQAIPELLVPSVAVEERLSAPTSDAAVSLTERERRRMSAEDYEEAQRLVRRCSQEVEQAEGMERRAMERVASLAARLANVNRIVAEPKAILESSLIAGAIIATALALVAIAIFALTRPRTKPVFSTALEVEAALGLPALGVVAALPTIRCSDVEGEVRANAAKDECESIVM